MKSNAFDRIYRDVPQEQKEQLITFRATHPAKNIAEAGTDWEYLSGGRGEEALLYLTGAFGRGENAFRRILALESEYRVVAPSYPSVTTMVQLVDGIVDILDSENIRQTHVFGSSYGGMVAQCLVRRYPDRVGKLILSATGAPKPDLGKQIEKVLKVLPFLPTGLIHVLVKLRFRKMLAGQEEFWLAYFNEMFATITKEDLVTRYEVAADFALNYAFTPDDLQDWPGSVLILQGEDDPLVKASEQEALKVLYPRAQVHIFHGTGHVAEPEELVLVVKDFLRESCSSP